MRDIDAAEDWLDSWVAGVDAQAARAAELARQVSALTATARSDDESITVTVGSNGQVEDLELDDRVHRLSGRDLSRQILAVMRTAQHRLSGQVAAEVQRTVGTDTETGRAVIDAFDRRFPEPEAPAEQ
jgi:DNA-binding protein YbaB